MKKLVTLLLVVIMSFAPLATYARSFIDVPYSHWAYDAISYFSDSGTIIGVGNDMFVPNEFISREEFAKLISEIYAKTSSDFATQTFADVTPDMWSYNYIESVKEYLTGYFPQNGDPFFNPKGKAAREDVAYALVKIIGLDKLTQSEVDILGRFEDSNEISYHLKSYVATAVSSGLMQGYENQLRPQDGITRAETAALLFRAIKKPVAGDEQAPEDTTNDPAKPAQPSETVTEPDGYSIETTHIKQIAGYKEDAIKGKVTLEYNPEENEASFLAKMKCYNGPFEYVDCEIELKNAHSVAENEIKGTFWFSVKKENFEGTISLTDGVLKLTTPTDNIDLIAHYGNAADTETPEKEEVQEPAAEKEPLPKIEYKKKSNSIAATKIYLVEITKSGEHNMTSTKNIDGYMRASFGDDAIEDTEFVAEFTADGNRYYIESDTILGYNHNTNHGESVSVRLTYDVYKNDKLIAEDVRNSFSVNKANDAFELGGSVEVCAETLDWNIDTLPDNPIIEKEVSPWEGASSVYASVSELEGEKASGMMSLRYKTAASLAEANIELTSGENKYVIELTKLDEITADKITAKFKISLNGQIVGENVSGEITGYSGTLKDTLSFECDYENLAIAGMIVEVGN